MAKVTPPTVEPRMSALGQKLNTLEGITTLHELISELIRSALFDEALQAGLRTRLDEMKLRLSRLAERGLKKRQLALETMCGVGLKKLEQPDFTASARTGTAGMSSPRPTASSATTHGIDILCPRAAFGLTRQTITMRLPIQQRSALPCGPAR